MSGVEPDGLARGINARTWSADIAATVGASVSNAVRYNTISSDDTLPSAFKMVITDAQMSAAMICCAKAGVSCPRSLTEKELVRYVE